MINFEYSYTDLGEAFFYSASPELSPNPQLLLWNSELASSLNISGPSFDDDAYLAQLFSGNEIGANTKPIALAYSGHQFGHFNPQLGDGRAHLLGEVVNEAGQRLDIQLKGSGKTPFSRRGDGKCALAPAIREYIMSEAMYSLGVPTSRSLAVVSTGEVINRGVAKAGAVVTRVAKSHIRVGTFQYFAARGNTKALQALLDYTINRHFPEINQQTLTKEARTLSFLKKEIDKQITLVIHWLRVGFIHGVMNTDNTAISGETIDYGPCAMMGTYHQDTVFSSIDEYGRYAFSKQSKIAQWNMARLADCLLVLLTEDQDNILTEEDKKQQKALALEKVESLIIDSAALFERAYYTMYANKLGFAESTATTQLLVDKLLKIMESEKLDYTNTFLQLTLMLSDESLTSEGKKSLQDWYKLWVSELENRHIPLLEAQTLMKQNNPVVIPRNHHVENILSKCEQVFVENNYFTDSETLSETEKVNAFNEINSIVQKFLTVLRTPYQQQKNTHLFQEPPRDNDQHYRTFCGT